ncbi:MAG: hypothetical protein AB1791_19195 [Chloroflexota bacterium]
MPNKIGRRQSRIPRDSFFFERVFPILLIILGVITLLLIIVAAGILLGLIPFS